MRLFLALSAAQVPSAPALAEVEALSPLRAGERLLRGRDHRPIIAAHRAPRQTMAPPGQTEYELLEAPLRREGGCVRRRWTARFVARPPARPADVRIFADIRPREEVALPAGRACPKTGYASLSGDIGQRQAIAALRRLQRVAAGALRPTIRCTTEVDTGSCASPAATRAALRAARAWSVGQSREGTELWLGEPGQLVTIVGFPAGRPDLVTVRQKIPAPF
jgi:hypothetical protein